MNLWALLTNKIKIDSIDFVAFNFWLTVAKIDWIIILTLIRRVFEEIDEVGDARELGLWLLLVRHVSTSGVDVKASQKVPVVVTDVVVLHAAFEKSEMQRGLGGGG